MNNSVTNPNITITIFILLGVGVISLIAALVWTKLIKKNRYLYCNKTYFTIKTLSLELKRFLKTADINNPVLLSDLFISATDQFPNCFFYLNNILITNKGLYLITYELSRSAKGIQQIKNKPQLVSNKGQYYDFPMEVQTVLDNYQNATKLFQTKLHIIIPFANPTVAIGQLTNNPNIHIVHTKQVGQLILHLEQTSHITNLQPPVLRAKIAQHNYQRRIKLPFVNWSTKDTVWAKKS